MVPRHRSLSCRREIATTSPPPGGFAAIGYLPAEPARQRDRERGDAPAAAASHDALVAIAGDVGVGEADFAQHGFGVFAEQRRVAAVGDRGVR